DWFESREILALALLSVASLVTFAWHELHTAHPVVDLRILKSRQLAAGVAFGGALGTCLYATVFVLPVYLQQVIGFTANQTGLVILPGAIASAVTMAVSGRFLAARDSRPFIVTGVLLFTLAMWQWSHFTTQSGYWDFFWPLIVRGVGLGLVFVPLTNLALAELPMDRIPAGTGLFNLLRQLGGSVGIALSATLVSRLVSQYRGDLLRHVAPDDALTRIRLDGLTRALLTHGSDPLRASAQAVVLLDRQVTRQATMLAFERIFILFGLAFVLALPLLLFMHRRRSVSGGLVH
ncbi:MAG TPA: MFS transporter, partial [Dongiaceae bacterium]|nr:MFS transporter [Dongiaceae bacterium]